MCLRKRQIQTFLYSYRDFGFNTFSNIDQPFMMQQGIITHSSRTDDSPVPSVYSYRNSRKQNEGNGFIFNIKNQDVSAFFRYFCVKIKALEIFRVRRTRESRSCCSQKKQTALIAKAATRHEPNQVPFTYVCHSHKITPELKVVC